jgi:hypothetical protein
MDKTKKRNIIGSIVCLLLSVLLGGLGIAIMMFREVHQADKYGFEVEKDDIIRYAGFGIVGYTIQITLIFLFV